MIIEGIKNECERIAEGNNGRIRPSKLIINRENLDIVMGEIESLSSGGHWQAGMKPTRLIITIQWDSWEWRCRVGPDEAKTYEIPYITDGDMDAAYDVEIECTQCGNRPIESADEEYYCPVCE